MHKAGEKLLIHGYKHNGNVHKSWAESLYIDENDDFYIVGNNKTLVTESDGRTWKTKEPAIIFFSKKNWFNVIAQIKSTGITYYCDLASPCIIEDGTVKYIDYDLDVRVFPDYSFKILDKGEYQYHKRIMEYSDDIDNILKEELANLIEKIRSNSYPFDHKIVLENFEKYEFLEKVGAK